MNLRRSFFVAMFVLALLTALLGVWRWTVDLNLTTAHAADLIKTGMTRDQVIALIGQPSKEGWVQLGGYYEFYNARDGLIRVYYDENHLVTGTFCEVEGFLGQFWNRLDYKLFASDARDPENP